ncbi:MAG TPA: nucleotidyltransferase, partial [Candidatus Marinimicrobia bacterium]|nr:nucleotidyltransferase [Candidatus Neomarinimicrobiota bacterium]
LRSNANWFGVTYKEDKPYVMGEIQKLVDGNVYPKKLF